MDPNVSRLIRDLETSECLRVGGRKIPKEESVEALGRTGDPDAIPALQKALEESIEFKNAAENLQRGANPFAAGSASPFLAVALAEQVVTTIRQAIQDCRSSVSAAALKKPSD